MTENFECVFFGLLLEAVIGNGLRGRIAATRRKYGFTGPNIPPERLHVSLQHIGNFETQPPPGLVEILSHIASQLQFPPFVANFDQALSFRGSDRHPFVLTGGAGLNTLRLFQQKLSETLQGELGLPVARSFTPHITLFYDKTLVPKHTIQPVNWTVRDFVLIQSSVGRSHYTPLGRWTLKAEA